MQAMYSEQDVETLYSRGLEMWPEPGDPGGFPGEVMRDWHPKDSELGREAGKCAKPGGH